jgi:hypothetical protein
VARNASRPGWDASHDYFLLRLFQSLVGDKTLAVAGDAGSGVLVYAYCARSAPGGAVLVTAINTLATPQALRFAQAGSGAAIAAAPRTEWVLTALGGDLSSTTPVLNGGGAPLRLGEDGSAPGMPGREVGVGGEGVVLPPLSQGFFLLPAAGAAACA